jgi:TM2 domain-containing membrane protein YozV
VLGCFIAGVLVVFLFANVSFIWWPLLVIVVVILGVIAAAMGLLRGIFDTLFGRRR